MGLIVLFGVLLETISNFLGILDLLLGVVKILLNSCLVLLLLVV